MKQISKSAQILTRLQKAVGNGVDTDNLVVYEAIALNTRPLRKRSPLYKGAIVGRDVLLEMAAQLERESIPLQIMHDGNVLPLGRAFHGEVVNRATEDELRVLFFIDKTNQAMIDKIEAGSVDQVSVSMVSKKLTCSACGFDFFGKDVTFEQIFSATCDEGHTLGKNGVHANLQGLDQWFELSLVGSGGAQNARIVGRDQSHFNTNPARLAASGRDLDDFILTATADEDKGLMEKELLDRLTGMQASLTTAEASVATLAASVATRDAEITRLTALVAAAGDAAAQLAARDTEITELKANGSKAEGALKDVAKVLLVALGQADPTLPEGVDALIASITENRTKLAAALAAGGRAAPAEGEPKNSTPISAAFRVRRAR